MIDAQRKRRRTSSESSSSSDERARVGSVADAERREDVYPFHVRHAKVVQVVQRQKRRNGWGGDLQEARSQGAGGLSDRICAVRAYRAFLRF